MLTRSLLRVATCGGLAILTAACLGPFEGDCPSILYPSIVVEARDQNGVPTAVGAMVSATRRGEEFLAPGWGDSLSIPIFAGSRGGRFDVTVEKPWHTPVELRNVRVLEDSCGVPRGGWRVMKVTLQRESGAPPVRQVVLPPWSLGSRGCTTELPIPVHVEADEGAPAELLWLSRDTTVATVSQEGLVRGVCGEGGTTYIVAQIAADPTVRDSIRISIDPQ